MRLALVAKYLGQLWSCWPSLLWRRRGAPWGLVMVIRQCVTVLVLAGLPSLRIATPKDLQANEALVVVALAFVMAPLLMIYPVPGCSGMAGWVFTWR